MVEVHDSSQIICDDHGIVLNCCKNRYFCFFFICQQHPGTHNSVVAATPMNDILPVSLKYSYWVLNIKIFGCRLFRISHCSLSLSLSLSVVMAIFTVGHYAVARCLSVSCWCIVSRRLKISSNFFLGQVAPSLLFSDPEHWYSIPRGTPSAGAQNTRGGKLLRFSTEIAVYLIPFYSCVHLLSQNYQISHGNTYGEMVCF